MSSIAHTPTLSRRPARTRSLPRLSRRAGFWAIAFSFLILSAFSTAPSALYGLYAQHEHLAPLTLTVVYAVYAAGVTASLLLAGHVSDWYGRKAVLIPALALAAVAAVVFIAWQSLTGLLLARVLPVWRSAPPSRPRPRTSPTWTPGPTAPSRRSGSSATIANVGGLAIGPLAAGLLAHYMPDGLTLTFVVLLAGLIAAIGVVARSPEGREPVHPLPQYRPQRLRAPARRARSSWRRAPARSSPSPSAGCSRDSPARFLAGPLHHPSAVLTGLVIFLNFGAGVLVQSTTTRWAPHRLIAAGLVTIIAGLTSSSDRRGLARQPCRCS